MTPDSPADLSIPDYELLRPIGRGSYGEVWLARSVTGVFRVIKIVRRDRFEDERPFLRELEGITRFQIAASGRPRQLALLHVGRNEKAGYFYYVMEPADDAELGSEIIPEKYVPLTLKELFHRRGRLPATECVHLALELARGLAVLHAANLIHRDIKPSNIIFVQRVPKLADVGLVADSQATMTCAGTPGYAPREGAGTVAADIYSLGKVLYETATGLDRMEFPRLPAELADEPDAPLLRELNAIVLRACHPNPEERHASAETLARDLELVQAGRSVAFYEAVRRRTRAIAIAAALVAVVAGLGTALLIWRSNILQRANASARHALYRSDLAVAQLARASGDLGRARAALARQIPAQGETDLRGLEWAILAHSVQGEGSPLESATNGVAVTAIAVDPSGRWAAASFANQSAAVWDLHTGRIQKKDQVLTPHLPLSEQLFDLNTGRTEAMHRTFRESKAFFTNITTEPLYTMLPTGKLFVDQGNSLTLVESGTLPQISTIHIPSLWSNYTVSASCCSPDGKFFAIGMLRMTGAGRQRALAVASLQTKNEVWFQPVQGRVLWIKCSPSNELFAVNIGGLTPTICRLDATNQFLKLEGHTARVQDASFSPSGRFIATASADQTIKVWNVATGVLLQTYKGLGSAANSVAWMPNEDHLIAGDDSGSVRLFSFQKQARQDYLPGAFADVNGDVVLNSNGTKSAVTLTTNSIGLVNPSTATLELTLTNLFQPIAYNDNDNILLALASDWSVKKIDLKTLSILDWFSFAPPGFQLNSWALSSNGKRYAIAANNGSLFVLDLENGSSRFTKVPGEKNFWGVAIEPTNQVVFCGGSKGAIRQWQFSTKSGPESMFNVDGDVQVLSLSDDSKWLAIGLFDKPTVEIWDRLERRRKHTLVGHRRFVMSISFSHDSRRLVTSGADGRVIIWRVPEFEELAAFEIDRQGIPGGDEGISSLKIARDESVIGALTEDGILRFWRSH